MSEYSIPDFNEAALGKRGPVMYQENRHYVPPAGIVDEITDFLTGKKDPTWCRYSDEIFLIHLVLFKRPDTQWLDRMIGRYQWIEDITLLWDTGLSIEDIYKRLYNTFHPTKGALDGSSSHQQSQDRPTGPEGWANLDV
jgi:hypothetical protein